MFKLQNEEVNKRGSKQTNKKIKEIFKKPRQTFRGKAFQVDVPCMPRGKQGQEKEAGPVDRKIGKDLTVGFRKLRQEATSTACFQMNSNEKSVCTTSQLSSPLFARKRLQGPQLHSD